MGIEDHVLLGYTPVGYIAASDLVEDHISGIDAKITSIIANASVLSGRPGDNLDKTPDLVALAAQSIPTPLAYFGMNFDQENALEPGDTDHFMTEDALYLPFHCRNARAALASPVGSGGTNIGAPRAFVWPAVATEHALIGDMTFLCMNTLERRIDTSNHAHIVEYGSWSVGTETGVGARIPYRLKMSENAGETGSQGNDKVLEYSHYSAGDAEIIATCARGVHGIGIPTGPEFGIGYTREVTGTSEIKFYVNGSKAGDTVSGLTNPGAAGNAVTMALHAGGKHAGANSYTGGTFRAFAIWDSVLTEAQINAFYELCVGKI